MKRRILLFLPLALLPLAAYAEDKPMQGIIEHHEPIAAPSETIQDYPKPMFVPVDRKAPPATKKR